MHYPHPIELAARRRRMTLIGAGSALVAGIIVYLLWPTGPFYQWHSLDAWLQDYINPFRHVNSVQDLRMGAYTERMENSRKAVRAIGTNGIPRLVQLLQARGPTAREIITSPLGLRRFGSSWFPSAREQNTMAAAGFAILQKDAMPAEPALIALTKDNDAGVRLRAFHALVLIEPTNYQRLVSLLLPFAHDPDPDNRERAAGDMRIFLASMSPEQAEKAGVYDAFPELHHPDSNVQPATLDPDLVNPYNL
jgi:hypothetical protein